jgi:FkbM family methyltransferase
MDFLKPLYKFAWTVRQGPLGEGLAKAWHKTAPSMTIWKRIYGVDVCLDLRDSLIWWGVDAEYHKEAEGFHVMLEGVKGNVWDVGCNVGIFSLYAASQGNKVVAFDISPRAIELVKKSAERNRLDVTAIGRAFSVESFKYAPPADADTRNRSATNSQNQTSETSITFLEAEAKFGRPSFIKMDIEYAEVDFLKSAKFHEWIRENKIPLLVELHEDEFWNLVWKDVPYCKFDNNHVYFNPPPEIAAKRGNQINGKE